MKTLLKILVAVVVVVLVVPLATYRTLSPCEMLRKELVRQTERQLEAARDSVREATGALGKEAQDAADAIAAGVQDMAASLAAGAAAAKTERMSARACVAELVRTRMKGGA
jgi:uncharacterized membrane-anchored protein